MQLRKYRWSRHYESAEEELFQHFKAKKISAERREAEAGQAIAPSHHQKDTQLFCAEGSMTLAVAGTTFSLQPGDALDLPAATEYSATAGISGVVWYQSA